MSENLEFSEWKKAVEVDESTKETKEKQSDFLDELLQDDSNEVETPLNPEELMSELDALMSCGLEEEGISESDSDTSVFADFAEFSTQRLMDGLTLEVMHRHAKGTDAKEETFCPLEYTSAPTSIDGFSCYGQLEPQKLTLGILKKIDGTPLEDMEVWKYQSEQNSCAVTCSSFILQQEGYKELTEAVLLDEVRSEGIYNENGTMYNDVGCLCEQHGMTREIYAGAQIDDLEKVLNGGGKIIAMVSCMRLAFPKKFGFFRADHAVQVIGVDRNDPEDIRIILNDPGREDGKGLSVLLKNFEKAWKTSGNSIVVLYAEGGNI